MDEKILLRVSLITSLMGVTFLFFVLINTNTTENTIEYVLQESYEDDFVKLIGIVNHVDIDEKISKIQISQPNLLEIIVFSDGILNVEEGERIIVEGNIEQFKNKKEIIATKIVSLSNDT